MQLPDAAGLIATLGQAGVHVGLVSTGGGSAAIAHLLTTPGAGDVVLEALVPYARAAVDRLLGGLQESYCSSRTARRLAAAGWDRAAAVAPADPTRPPRLVGAAVTAGLRTRQPKRGAHRAVAAAQTLAATIVGALELDKGARSRGAEELVAAALLLDVMMEAADCGWQRGHAVTSLLRPGERVVWDRCDPPTAWRELMAGGRASVPVGDLPADATPVPGMLVFPGSFDPLHDGHRLMARIAAEVAERPVDHELSLSNVEKPPLDYLEIRDRAAQFAGRRLWLTRAATFLEKLDVFPEATFVVGADTYVRLADPRFYGGSAAAAAAAVEAIATRSRGLVVFGRVRDGEFQEASRLPVPERLREVSYFVSRREFRLDVSSTQLRCEARARAAGAEG